MAPLGCALRTNKVESNLAHKYAAKTIGLYWPRAGTCKHQPSRVHSRPTSLAKSTVWMPQVYFRQSGSSGQMGRLLFCVEE